MVINKNILAFFILFCFIGISLYAETNNYKPVISGSSTSDNILKEAMNYSYNGQHYKSIELYKELIDTNTTSAIIYINLAREYRKVKEFDTSLKYLNQALKEKNDFTNSLIYNEMGNIYLCLESYKKAEEVFKKAYSISPGKYKLEALGNLVNVYIKQSKFEKAQEYFNSAMPQYYLIEGEFAYYNKEYNKAIGLFNKYLNYNNKNSDSYYYLAKSYSKLQQYKVAISSFKKAIKLSSIEKKIYIYPDLINVYNDLQEYDKVLNLVSEMEKEIVQNKFQKDGLLILRGQTYAYKKQYTKSLNYFLQYLEIYPQKAYVYPWLFQLQLFINNKINKKDEESFLNIKNKEKYIVNEYEVVKHLENILNNQSNQEDIDIFLKKHQDTKIDNDFFDWLKPWINKKEEPIKTKLLDAIKQFEDKINLQIDEKNI